VVLVVTAFGNKCSRPYTNCTSPCFRKWRPKLSTKT